MKGGACIPPILSMTYDSKEDGDGEEDDGGDDKGKGDTTRDKEP